MRSCPSISLLRELLRRYPALITPALMLFFRRLLAAKTRQEKATEVEQAAPSEAATEAAEEPSPEPTPAPPSVTVHISNAHRGDYTESLSVDKFAGATLIPTHGEKAGSALVRFEGGEPVWAIAADRGVSGSAARAYAGSRREQEIRADRSNLRHRSQALRQGRAGEQRP